MTRRLINWKLSVSNSSPLFQFFLKLLCIQNRVKPVLVKFLKISGFQFKSAFRVTYKYLTISFSSCNQPKVPPAPICAQVEKSIWSIIIPIKTPLTSLKIFFRIFFVLLFGNTEIFQPFRFYRQQLWPP